MASLGDCLTRARKCCFKNSSTVDVLEYIGEGQCRRAKYKDLSAYLSTLKTQDQSSSLGNSHSTHPNDSNKVRCRLRLFFISATIGEDGLHTHVDPALLELLHEESNLSAKFIVDLYQTEDWTVFPTSFALPRAREVTARSTLQYGCWPWGDQATHSFVQLVVEPDTMTYYFINFNEELKQLIERSLKDHPGPTATPLFLDLRILTHLLTLYRRGLEDQRYILRRIENQEDASTVRNQVRELHDLCRRWHAMLKDFADLKEHTKQLEAFAERLNTTYYAKQPDCRDAMLETVESLVQFENDCNFWANWARTYLERTNICINLAHQLENKEIALQARRESISMFTLAIVTVFFLPSTFVASILGTNFFNFDGTVFAVSGLWWTLPVISIPLTLAVLFLWYKWSKVRSDMTEGQSSGGTREKKTRVLSDVIRRLGELVR
ncbi:hypothetical protein O1611_g4612 [Lasiodiplodia mahajangana]|uniref:Uncharacterized protein n=1 Tax=Lasiodiplodia mahajangana TaxID=1108764 RepID=A0ACC2JNG0_9PEZI|nr:hypothetical protein O1611_g4612 [Lasiodiplodia mahajangana]